MHQLRECSEELENSEFAPASPLLRRLNRLIGCGFRIVPCSDQSTELLLSRRALSLLLDSLGDLRSASAQDVTIYCDEDELFDQFITSFSPRATALERLWRR